MAQKSRQKRKVQNTIFQHFLRHSFTFSPTLPQKIQQKSSKHNISAFSETQLYLLSTFDTKIHQLNCIGTENTRKEAKVSLQGRVHWIK